MGKAAPPGRVPLEALILAFSHSRARTLVGTDALRSVLSGQYRELHNEGSFELEPVWQLLSQQPGFDPVHVRPPLARFKNWERELRIVVRLPAAMADLGELELNELAAHVHVPAHERARVFGGSLVPSHDPEAAAAAEREVREDSGLRQGPRADALSAVEPTIKTSRLRRLTRTQRRMLEVGAFLLALAGFAVGGVQLQRGCRTHPWEEMATRFAGEIPIGAAQRQGPEVSGGLRDARWLSLAASVRTAHMKSALEALPRDVDVFFVRDPDGKVRAVARWFGQPRQIAVTLQ